MRFEHGGNDRCESSCLLRDVSRRISKRIHGVEVFSTNKTSLFISEGIFVEFVIEFSSAFVKYTEREIALFLQRPCANGLIELKPRKSTAGV